MSPGRGPAGWDDRYADPARPWTRVPSATVTAALAGLAPESAVDVAAGTGRHALWLAERGWQVTAVDFSAVGIAQGRAEAEARRLAVDWVVADARDWSPAVPPDLVLAAHVQLGVDGFRRCAGWLAPGGRLVIVGHALRNALLPVATVIGLQFGFLLGGAVLTETVFSWPGVGLQMYKAIISRDIPLIQGTVLMVAALFVLINLGVDLVYSYLDPRIRYS